MKAKMVVGLLVIAAIVLVLPSAMARADGTYDGLIIMGGAEEVDYSYNGSNRLTILIGTPLTLSGSTTTMGVAINTNVTANLTLQDATIDARGAGAAMHLFNGAALNLTVLGNNTLRSKDNYGGIDVVSGKTLVITAASTGTLNVTGGNDGAGIGGGNGCSGGHITIWSGTINATGAHDGAGIGGGRSGCGGTIIIHGGTVKAMGGSGAGGSIGAGAGIGGGAGGDGGNISIYDGTVEAESSFWAAGIGGGLWGDGGTIVISGGTIKTTGNIGGAGIGGGAVANGGNITISGGTVNATGNYAGAGIGGGQSGDGGTVKITGGMVFANSLTGPKDIGAGAPYDDAVLSDGSLEISGTAAVFLKNDTCLSPTTSTHTHINAVGHTASTAFYGYPVAWSGDFGAYLILYPLSYELNGGEASPANPPYYGPQCSSFVLTNPIKAGYTFTGWTGTDIAGLSLNVTILPSLTGNRAFTANWASNTYDEAVPTPRGTVVNCTRGVNVRSGPGTNYPIIGIASRGNTYLLLGQSGLWYKVNFGSKTGYISARYFLASSMGQISQPTSPIPESGQGLIVNCRHSVNVRNGPSTDYPIIGFAPKGAAYTVTGRFGVWYKIEFGSNTGYISARYFSVSSSASVL
ncbi:MAG: SH3 domain-containing protein [Candidatus Pelethousia sp.]|nr:SH3 domain-containing protein [Candidatus Pelethousia sp.]